MKCCYELCSGCCHRLVTMLGAWFYEVLFMNHAPAVVIA